MIATLRSIDSLLNQFDELSKFHSNLLTDFDNNFSGIDNPLRHVTRTKDEQEKSVTHTLFEVDENNNPFGSIGPLEDFHRRILKNRFLHRPPNYSSNDGTLFRRTSSISSSTTTESAALSKIMLTTNKGNSLQSIVPTSNNRINQPKVKEPKSASRRQARGKVTVFTMETINRLSKPKRYNQTPDHKSPSKPAVNMKKEVPKDSALPPIKRAKANIDNSSSKKLKIENKIPIQTSSKKPPARHVIRPVVLITSKSTAHPNPPIQTQQKSSHHTPLPKITTTIKRSKT